MRAAIDQPLALEETPAWEDIEDVTDAAEDASVSYRDTEFVIDNVVDGVGSGRTIGVFAAVLLALVAPILLLAPRGPATAAAIAAVVATFAVAAVTRTKEDS